MLAWPVGGGGWLGIGLGDLLLATVGPLVFRKAFGRTAGVVAIVRRARLRSRLRAARRTAGGLLAGTFPVMVVLGPLLVGQYVYWTAPARRGADDRRLPGGRAVARAPRRPAAAFGKDSPKPRPSPPASPSQG